MRKYVCTCFHLGCSIRLEISLTIFDGFKYPLEGITYINGNDSRRCFVCAKSVIITGRSNGHSHDILILIDSLDNCSKEKQELSVLLRVLAGIQKVLAL